MRNPPASRRLLAAGVVAVGLAAAGCGSPSAPAADGAPTPTPVQDRGPITLASSKDTTGTVQAQLDRWNTDHPAEKVTLVELPESADQQRQLFIQNAQTKSDAYTVLNMDVVWTAEFAANRWIDELPADKVPTGKMIPAVVETATYFNKLYAVPYNTNGGLLFYRKDLLDAAHVQPPTTWAEMKDACAKIKALPQGKDLSCYAGQFDKYEGLTVNFAEAVDSAGGSIVDAEGKPTVDTDEARKGLAFLADSFKDGTIAKSAISFKEEEGRRDFQAGKLIFHRQWPYQWELANKSDGSSKVAGKFGVAPLPGLTGPGKSSLGGLNLAVSAFAKHKATALDFISFFASEDNARKNLEASSAAPPYADLYTDSELVKKYPYLPVLRDSINTAAPRPRVVAYGDFTAVIQENAYAAISGTKPVDQALTDMQAGLLKVVSK
ncbi:ABC transporter substrate-binding protein [Sphaerisporangium sp. NPDC051017]|uniref:ABC transporter substrate-binding protein n=1 Tax=Sphaerisporangium sp. NPDC051017 TaxID=3154636 RepID=UPI0034241BA4